MSSEFKWTINPVNKQSTKLVLNYLIERGKDLETQTEGKVIGSLVKTRHPIMEVAKRIAEMSSASYSQRINKDSKDASAIYEREAYQFVIYDRSHTYELCVFTVRCNDFMPVYIDIDPTIADEEGLEKTIEVSCFETFETLFCRIVSSTKVVYVISHLNNLPDEPVTQSPDDAGTEQNASENDKQNQS